MAVTPKKIITAAQLTASAATYYTVPVNTRTIIKKLTFVNNDSVARTVTVYLVPSAGSAGVTNIISKAHALAPSESWDCTEAEQIMNAGDFIQALADSASQVTIHGSGVEIVQ